MREKAGIGRVIFLGDSDSPEVLEQILGLDMPKVVIPGNHDYPFMRDALLGLPAESLQTPDYLAEGTGPETYKGRVAYWKNSRSLKKFTPEWLSELDEDKRFVKIQEVTLPDGAMGKIAFVHGGLNDNPSDRIREMYWTDERPYQLWDRLVDSFTATRILPFSVENNLLRMKEMDLWLLVRGHDHMPEIFSLGLAESPIANYPKVQQHVDPALKEQTIEFSASRRYLISVGSQAFSQYAVWDDSAWTITFISPRAGGG